MKQLIYNSVKCLNCGEILVSQHVHDYKTCSCDNATMCDGGVSYGRFGGMNLDLIETNYIYDDAPHEVIREYLSRGGRGVNGDEPLKYVVMKDIDDDWLKAIVVYEEERRPNNIYLKHFKNES